MPANNSATKEAAAFAKHKSAAVRNDNDNNNGSQGSGGAKMSLLARFLIFVFVPSFTGLVGYGISYLQSMQSQRRAGNKNEGEVLEEPHEVNFDRDFVTPFLLSLAFVIVLGFQTNGFSMKPGEKGANKGAFAWPKARKVQKIRRERVIVDDEEDDIDGKKEQ